MNGHMLRIVAYYMKLYTYEQSDNLLPILYRKANFNSGFHLAFFP